MEQANPRDHPDFQALSNALLELKGFNQRFTVHRQLLFATMTITLPIGLRDVSFSLDPINKELNVWLIAQDDPIPFSAQIDDLQELWRAMLDNDANPSYLELGD